MTWCRSGSPARPIPQISKWEFEPPINQGVRWCSEIFHLLLHQMKRRSISYHHPKLFLSGSTATSQGYHAAEPAAYRKIHTGNELHPVLDSSSKLYCVGFPSFNHTSVETSGPIMRRLAGTLLQIRTCSPSVPSDCLECALQMFRAI